MAHGLSSFVFVCAFAFVGGVLLLSRVKSLRCVTCLFLFLWSLFGLIHILIDTHANNKNK